MSVTHRTIDGADNEMRIDRWFKREFPTVGHARLEKWLRTGQVRIDGKRAKGNARLTPGAVVRVPPIPQAEDRATSTRKPRTPAVDEDLARELVDSVLFMDDEVIAINKPPGLAVQGGTGTTRHLDGALDALSFDAKERPRLVHRLDKDTSGVMLLARTATAARWLTQAFRQRSARKVYWATVIGDLKPMEGRVDMAIAKLPGKAGERMEIDYEEGKRAVTDYQVVERLSNKVAWVAMAPITGRTHQLRVHMAALGTPVMGDGKYGGRHAYFVAEGLSRKLHLHAREVLVERPDGKMISATAPLPRHMSESWDFFGFTEANGNGVLLKEPE
jgi:23S rRNA pseudouridine955/2504/2580 synthase